MAAALKCEICGGKLIGKPGGVFECEYCGVQYDTAWAKAKIQEIKGTVKVEGTVEVQGTVKIDGPVKVDGGVNIESLLKRGQMALADEEWGKAENLFEEALKIDAEHAECYWGLLCAKYQYADVDSLLSTEYSRLRNDKDFVRAAKYADKKLQNRIAALEKKYVDQNAVNLAQSEKSLLQQNPFFAQILPAQHLVCCTNKVVVALKTDGTLLTLKNSRLDRFEEKWNQQLCEELATWRDIVAVSASHHNVVGLKSDGTVIAATSLSESPEIAVSEWRDIVAIDAGSKRTLGIKSDGTIVAAGKEYHPDPLTMIIRRDLSGWKNMAVVGHLYLTDYGIRKDGSIVLGDWIAKDSDEVTSVRRWKNIVALAACSGGTGSMAHYFVGLRPDGTLLRPDGSRSGKNIAALYTSGYRAYALDKDGNVYEINFNGDLNNYLMGQNVVAIAHQDQDLICLKADGTLIRRTWSNIRNDFEGWKLFENVDTIEQERLQIVEEKARQAEEVKAVAYEKALKILNNGSSVSTMEKAIDIFSQLNDYRDSADNILQCQIKLQELKNEEDYSNACTLLKTDDPSSVEQAQCKFQKLGDWRDSQQKAEKCEEKLALLRKIENERKALASKRKKLVEVRRNLEKERSNLGLFSSKRKKEIAAEIDKIDNELAQVEKELR